MGDSTVVVPRGEADIATRGVIVDVLAGVITDRGGDVVVDLAHAMFIDAAGQRAILRAKGVPAGAGGQLALRAPSPVASR